MRACPNRRLSVPVVRARSYPCQSSSVTGIIPKTTGPNAFHPGFPTIWLLSGPLLMIFRAIVLIVCGCRARCSGCWWPFGHCSLYIVVVGVIVVAVIVVVVVFFLFVAKSPLNARKMNEKSLKAQTKRSMIFTIILLRWWEKNSPYFGTSSK